MQVSRLLLKKNELEASVQLVRWVEGERGSCVLAGKIFINPRCA